MPQKIFKPQFSRLGIRCLAFVYIYVCIYVLYGLVRWVSGVLYTFFHVHVCVVHSLPVGTCM